MTTVELSKVIELKKALLEEIHNRLRDIQRKPYFEVRAEARQLERRAEQLIAEIEQDTADLIR